MDVETFLISIQVLYPQWGYATIPNSDMWANWPDKITVDKVGESVFFKTDDFAVIGEASLENYLSAKSAWRDASFKDGLREPSENPYRTLYSDLDHQPVQTTRKGFELRSKQYLTAIGYVWNHPALTSKGE